MEAYFKIYKTKKPLKLTDKEIQREFKIEKTKKLLRALNAHGIMIATVIFSKFHILSISKLNTLQSSSCLVFSSILVETKGSSVSFYFLHFHLVPPIFFLFSFFASQFFCILSPAQPAQRPHICLGSFFGQTPNVKLR